MDAKYSVANTSLTRRKSFGFLNLQDSIQANDQPVPQPFQGFMVYSGPQDHNALAIRNMTAQKPNIPVSLLDFHGKADMTKNSCDEDSYFVTGDQVDVSNESEKEKKESPWHRVKWTDRMVKLLITALSYIGEDAGSSLVFPKKGKWKAISKVMSERGFLVSPQQCEDKFNDLNKRYKKLNDILGRGTPCEVVQNPALLDLIDISDKSKESVRKILSSKQLFYREMCSYHNGNRMYIPHDQAIQKSLQSALRNTDDLEFHEGKAYKSEIGDEEEENDEHALNEDLGSAKVTAKRKKFEEDERMESDQILSFQITTKKSSALHVHAKMNRVSGQGANGERQGKNWFTSRGLELEEQKLHIEAEMMELEKQRLRWLRFRELEDRDLEKMRLENTCLKLENERLALEIRRREMDGHANAN